MTEVMDQRLVIELLGAQHETGRTMRAQADGRANDPVPRCVDGRENAARLLRLRLRLRARRRGRASFERESNRRHAAKFEKRTAIHARDSTLSRTLTTEDTENTENLFLNASAA